MEAYFLLVNLRKGMQSSSEQPSVGEERYVTTLIQLLVCRAVVEICVVNVRLHIFNNRPSATKNVFAGKRYFSLNKAKEEKKTFL